MNKPFQFPVGSSDWWKLPRHQLTPEQLEVRRKYDREWRANKRATDPIFRDKDKAAYHRCISKDRTKAYARNSKWRKENWPAVLESRRRPNYRIASQMRCRIHKAIKTQRAIKSKPMLGLLGCSLDELKAHLEKQFLPWMTWENYGPKWHIDHIKPCSAFNLLDPEEQAKCFHFTNLQPLEARENLKKSSSKNWQHVQFAKLP